MKTFINQGKRVYIIGGKRIEPNSYFTLTDEEYKKVKGFNEIKPLFVIKNLNEEKAHKEEKDDVEEAKVSFVKNKNKNKHK